MWPAARLAGAAFGLAAAILVLPASAATISVTAAADATLFEDAAGSLANGAGPNLFVGRVGANAGTTLRRGLVRFDLATLPPGATVRTATLRLSLTRSRFAGDLPVDVHRVTAAWTTGASASAQGGGEPALPGDATWLHRSYPGVRWNNPGGDFTASPSASRVIGSTGGPYDFSSAGLAADVQAWVANPASNHGWMLRGFEGPATSAKAFSTVEATNAADRPVLVIEYDPPAAAADVGEAPLPAWAAILLAIGLALGLRRRA